MNPFSKALIDFHGGNRNVTFTLCRDDGFQQQVTVAAFFDVENFPSLEIRAMDECYGKILDVGSAAGRHSLELLRRGRAVTSLDILPEMEVIMKDRGLSDIIIADVCQLTRPRRYDTLLMLMNGIGMAGNIEKLTHYLNHAHNLIVPGGQIVCDSIDVSLTTDPQHIAHQANNLKSGRPAGQQSYVMEYPGEDSVQFEWLHIDFPTLAAICDSTGWDAHLIESEKNGHYLCKIIDKQKATT